MDLKVNKILAEIERQMKWKPKAIPSGMRQRDVINIRKTVLLTLKDFINSLQVEKPSVDLEEEIKFYFKDWRIHPDCQSMFDDIAHYFAQWQKERTIKIVCEWLKNNASDYAFVDTDRIGNVADIDSSLIQDLKKYMEEEK